MTRRIAIIATFAVILVGGISGAGLSGALVDGDDDDPSHTAPPREPAERPAGDRAASLPGSAAAFRYLARQGSNRCDLQAREILAYAPSRRLQGSCCSPMDQSTYRHQVAHLRRYVHLAEVPNDPYDVAADLARRLLRYDGGISLNADQQRTYQRAMRLAREKGPCCCKCWRYDAFRGLSKHLIATRGWPPERLAELIDALDGCGGAAGEHKHG